MNYNSFGRKIKDSFSVTFKKDEDIIKNWLNEQISPTSYIKQLILDDIKRKENNINDTTAINNNEEVDYFNFNIDMED